MVSSQALILDFTQWLIEQLASKKFLHITRLSTVGIPGSTLLLKLELHQDDTDLDSLLDP